MAMTLADLIRSGKSPEEINAMLSESTIGSGSLDPNFMAGEPYMPPQQMPMPQNYIRNERTGATYDMGQSQQQFGPALDYSSPIEIGGYGKGYRLKGDVSRVVLSDGRIVRMGADTGADQKRMAADLQTQMTRQKLSEGEIDQQIKRAQLNELLGIDPAQGGGMMAQPQAQGVNGAQYRKEMAKIAAKEMSAKIPGTEEYKRIQDQQRKERSTLNDATNTRKYSIDTADALERNIADLMGVKVEDLPKILGDDSAAKSRVAPAVGSIDAMTPTFFQNTANIQSNIESLKSKAQMVGLTNLRKSGVAPGTVTEREWPKFESMLGNIDPRLGEAEFVKQIKDIYSQIKRTRDAGEVDYQQMTSGLPQSMLGGGKHVRVSNDAEYNALPKGAIYITPTGETRTKR